MLTGEENVISGGKLLNEGGYSTSIFDQEIKNLSPSDQEKVREFCFELAIALRRITGMKIDKGLETLPEMIREAVENANGIESTDQS